MTAAQAQRQDILARWLPRNAMGKGQVIGRRRQADLSPGDWPLAVLDVKEGSFYLEHSPSVYSGFDVHQRLEYTMHWGEHWSRGWELVIWVDVGWKRYGGEWADRLGCDKDGWRYVQHKLRGGMKPSDSGPPWPFQVAQMVGAASSSADPAERERWQRRLEEIGTRWINTAAAGRRPATDAFAYLPGQSGGW